MAPPSHPPEVRSSHQCQLWSSTAHCGCCDTTTTHTTVLDLPDPLHVSRVLEGVVSRLLSINFGPLISASKPSRDHGHGAMLACSVRIPSSLWLGAGWDLHLACTCKCDPSRASNTMQFSSFTSTSTSRARDYTGLSKKDGSQVS